MYSKEIILRLVLAFCLNFVYFIWLVGFRFLDIVGKVKKNVCEKRVGVFNLIFEYRFFRFFNLYLGVWNRLLFGCFLNYEIFLWMVCLRNGFCNNFIDGF